MQVEVKVIVVILIIVNLFLMFLEGMKKSDYLGKYIGYGHPSLKSILLFVILVALMIYGFYLNEYPKSIRI